MNSHQASSCFSTFSTFHLGEAPPNGLRGLGGDPINPPVEEDHDHHGSKERSNGAVEDIAGVAGQDALRRALGCEDEPTVNLRLRGEKEGEAGGVPGDSVTAPANERREADNEADDPNKTYQHFGPAVRGNAIMDWNPLEPHNTSTDQLPALSVYSSFLIQLLLPECQPRAQGGKKINRRNISKLLKSFRTNGNITKTLLSLYLYFISPFG